MSAVSFLTDGVREMLEAVLFAAGHPIAYTKLAEVLEISPAEAKKTAFEFADEYNSGNVVRGLVMLCFDEGCQLCTKQDYIREIRLALGIRKGGNLSNSSLEALAIVAYNQPVTRAYIDAVRGVDSGYAVSSLAERGLIESKSRLDAPGRPMLYTTTTAFLRSFGLSSLEELPVLANGSFAEFEKLKINTDGDIQAEAEVQQMDEKQAED